MAAIANSTDLLCPLTAFCVVGCRLAAVEAGVVSLTLRRICALLISNLNDRTHFLTHKIKTKMEKCVSGTRSLF